MKAVDNAGNAANASTAKTVIYDVIAPPVPGSFAAPAATKVKPTLTFTAATDTGGSGTDHYNVYRDDVLLGIALTTSYTETSTTYPDGAYSYAVSAVDKAGNEGPETTPKVVVYDTTAPIAPATPTTSAPVTKVKPAISWTATTDPGGSGVASYHRVPRRRADRRRGGGHELPGHRARRQRHVRVRHPGQRRGRATPRP